MKSHVTMLPFCKLKQDIMKFLLLICVCVQGHTCIWLQLVNPHQNTTRSYFRIRRGQGALFILEDGHGWLAIFVHTITSNPIVHYLWIAVVNTPLFPLHFSSGGVSVCTWCCCSWSMANCTGAVPHESRTGSKCFFSYSVGWFSSTCRNYQIFFWALWKNFIWNYLWFFRYIVLNSTE